MLAVKTTYLKGPTEGLHVLVGPEGPVTVVPALGGDPFVLAARDAGEQVRGARFVAQLVQMGLVPYGLPLIQRQRTALFGGTYTRDCAWVPCEHVEFPVTYHDEEDGATVVAWRFAVIDRQG